MMLTRYVATMWDHTTVLAKLVSTETEDTVLVTKKHFDILLFQLTESKSIGIQTLGKKKQTFFA